MALTADKTRTYTEQRGIRHLPVKAATKIYEGAFVGDDASGYARGLVAGDVFFGIALLQADNSAGLAAAIDAKVVSEGYIIDAVTGVTGLTDESTAVYASDDGTMTLTSSGNTKIGSIAKRISGTTCLVFFQAPFLRVS